MTAEFRAVPCLDKCENSCETPGADLPRVAVVYSVVRLAITLALQLGACETVESPAEQKDSELLSFPSHMPCLSPPSWSRCGRTGVHPASPSRQ